jgi:tetratricopeptide (TPR) repeat protein
LHFSLAVVFEKTGRFDAMVEELKKAIEINPKNADALNYLGYSYAEKNINISESYELVSRALDLKPDNGYIADSLGWVYYRQGKFDLALKTLQKAAEMTHDDPVVLEHLGDVYKELGEPEKAIQYWEKSVSFSEKEEGLKDRVDQKIQQLKSAVKK